MKTHSFSLLLKLKVCCTLHTFRRFTKTRCLKGGLREWDQHLAVRVVDCTCLLKSGTSKIRDWIWTTANILIIQGYYVELTKKKKWSMSYSAAVFITGVFKCSWRALSANVHFISLFLYCSAPAAQEESTWTSSIPEEGRYLLLYSLNLILNWTGWNLPSSSFDWHHYHWFLSALLLKQFSISELLLYFGNWQMALYYFFQ